MEIRKTYKYRIYPNGTARRGLDSIIHSCRNLYNAALEQRIHAYKSLGKTVSFYEQARELKDLRRELPEYYWGPGDVFNDVLQRLDKAYKAFFARVKRGETAGFPRFKGARFYNSFTLPRPENWHWKFLDGCLYINCIKASIKIILHRPIEGQVRTVSIIKEADNKWYACFSSLIQVEDVPHTGPSVGIDVGLENFASLSNGEVINNPRYFRKSEKELARINRVFDRARKTLEKTSHKYKAIRLQLSRIHIRIKNRRKHFIHEVSKALATTYSLIFVEDLNIKGMVRKPKAKVDEENSTPEVTKYLPNGAAAKSGLSKSIMDAGWYTFTMYIDYKVHTLGGLLKRIDPKYTSQTCPTCGKIEKKLLRQRIHICECGTEMHRDTAAAKIIEQRGLQLLAA